MRRVLSLVSLFLLAACSSEHPLTGSWNQQTADGKPGITIEFDTETDDCGLHGAPREDGSHRHAGGTYTFDAESGAMTVSMEIIEGGATEWTGKLEGGTLTLRSADQNLEFKPGKARH